MTFPGRVTELESEASLEELEELEMGLWEGSFMNCSVSELVLL